MPAHHDVRSSDVFTRRLHGTLAAAAERGPVDFPDLLLTPGVGARTVRSLAMVAEVVHGAPYRFRDPARFSLAHGGKDRHPYPVPIKVYDETIRVMKSAVRNAKLGRDEEMQALKRLDDQARRLERTAAGTLVRIFRRHRARRVAAAGRPVRIRMGKGSDAAKGGGVVAIEDLEGDEDGRCTVGVPGSLDQPETFGRSAILTSPSWLVNVSVRSALWACATPKIRCDPVSYTETVP